MKKKRQAESLEEGKVGPRHGAKHQKVTREPRDKRAPLVESRDKLDKAEIRVAQRSWSLRLEVDGAPYPWNASVQKYQRGRVGYIVEALE